MNTDARMLQCAAELLGGPTLLRDYLRVPTAQLLSWLEGKEVVPNDIYLKVVEIVVRRDDIR